MKILNINITAQLIATMLLLSSQFVSGQITVPQADLGGDPTTKIVGDHVLIRAAMQTSVWFKDSYIIVDYASPYALQMNQSTFETLQYAEDDTVLQIVAPGFRLDVPREGIIREKGARTANLTAIHDNELEQQEITAIIGWPMLKNFHLTLKVDNESLSLSAADEKTFEQAQQEADVTVRGLQIIDDSLFFPVQYGESQIGFSKFNTAGYHTYVNSTIVDPIDEVDSLAIRMEGQITLNLSGKVALFPRDLEAEEDARYQAELEAEHTLKKMLEEQNADFPPSELAQEADIPSGIWLLTTGMSFLKGYQIDLNPQNNYIAFTAVDPNQYSIADHLFYQATYAQDLSALNAYLQAYPADRNVLEAVELGIEWGLSANASDKELMGLLEYAVEASQERRRFILLAQNAANIYNLGTNCSQRRELVITVAERAMEYISLSQTPRIRQNVQMMLGDCYLAKADAMNAWRYFLSAAFNGDPNLDGVVRHELGRAYEAQGRLRRAYSSYSRALEKNLPQEMIASANEAMERISPQLAPDDPLLTKEP